MISNAQYTTTTPAFGLTATPATGVALPATDPSQYGNRPQAVLLQADTADMRFTTDGSAPTASVGMLLPAGAPLLCYVGPLVSLRFIQASAGAKLNVVYVGLDQAESSGMVSPSGLYFEAVDDTTVLLKYKGSDGTVRSIELDLT